MAGLHRIFILREKRNAEALWAFLRANWTAVAQTEHPLCVEVSSHSTKRSNAQNARYWKILQEISDQAWIEGKQYHPEIFHELAKRTHLGVIDLPGGGKMGRSTATLTTAEFADYCDKVEAWAATELGITFLDPSEPTGRF